MVANPIRRDATSAASLTALPRVASSASRLLPLFAALVVLAGNPVQADAPHANAAWDAGSATQGWVGDT